MVGIVGARARVVKAPKRGVGQALLLVLSRESCPDDEIRV
jgi:hypothetical protein